ncbi:MAG: DUF3307 domain-containing protein, partial [Flavobacteriaceae bacterium]
KYGIADRYEPGWFWELGFGHGMNPVEMALVVMLGLELKHFVADYLLQTVWMIKGKDSFAKAGGYAHAGVHVAGTAIVFLLLAFPLRVIATIIVAEFVVHYLLDFAKAHYGEDAPVTESPQKYWAYHGLDQLFHHITYIGMTYLVVLMTV